jgi:hypothetical protein
MISAFTSVPSEEDVGERAVVGVLPLLVVLEPDAPAAKHLFQEVAGLLAEVPDRPPGIDRLGSVDADQTDPADALDIHRVAVEERHVTARRRGRKASPFW